MSKYLMHWNFFYMANTKTRMMPYTVILVNPLFDTLMAHLQPLLFEVSLLLKSM